MSSTLQNEMSQKDNTVRKNSLQLKAASFQLELQLYITGAAGLILFNWCFEKE